jgi:23S rRNA (uracil1939-C5)-methyltransferase
MEHYPQELELRIDSMAQGGDGVGRWQGRVVFVAGALPGERVRVRLAERKQRYARGYVLAMLEAAPERIEPRLPAADHIPWQHIDYAAQVRFKQAILREQLVKLAALPDPPVQATLPAVHPWGYRNTAYMRVQQERIGYYAAGSRTVRDMPADPLLLPSLNEALAGLRPLLLADEARGLKTVTLRGSAAYGYAVALAVGAAQQTDLAYRWRAGVPTLAAVAAASTSSDDSPAVTLHEELGDIVFSLSPASFFQTNSAQAEILLRVMRDMLALQPHEHLLDGYSGVGAFALPLARDVRIVTAIEEHPDAVADGQRSAALNDIDNVHFVAAPVERALPDIPAPVHAAILDPPRRGCHPAALEALARLAPARIAYVSCQPGILARDLRVLLAQGYWLAAVQPVDMFPQTPHIECVALLLR